MPSALANLNLTNALAVKKLFRNTGYPILLAFQVARLDGYRKILDMNYKKGYIYIYTCFKATLTYLLMSTYAVW